jgi:hypothetical protein
MPRNKRVKSPSPGSGPGFFINVEVERIYRPTNAHSDPNLVLPALNWRSRLSQITPRVAAQMMEQGTQLIVKK